MEWDPIGTGIPEAADEYDCMMLMHLLHDGAGQKKIQRWITNEVTGHFGMRSNRRDEAQLSSTLIEWWSGRST